VVQNGAMRTAISPPPKRIRLTISVTPEVHETFTRLSKASGTSISYQMGEWLTDTLDAAEHMTGLVEKARAAPGLLARELHAYAMGLSDEMGAVVETVGRTGAVEALAKVGAPKRVAGAARGGAANGDHPPSSNTGGKTTPNIKKKQAR